MRLLRESLVPTPLFQLANPEARSRYHARIAVEIAPAAPTRHRRLLVFYYGTSWLFRLALLALQGRLTPRERGKLLRGYLEKLGGFWIKPGQILATRRDILPLEFCEELSRLQEKVVGFPSDEAIRIVEEDLGGPLANVFQDFDPKPFAAASVGQLHRAVLRLNQVTVAVKVQRPNLEETFRQDMKMIRALIGAIESLGLVKHIRLTEMADELSRILTEEFDFRYEASNITRMRKSLRKGNIYAPELWQQYCTKRVIVMEFVSGVSIADYIAALTQAPERLGEWLVENDIEPRRIGRRLFASIYRQLLEDNLFHGDLHPGNILLLRKSRVAFLDFGAVGTLDVGFHRKYVMMQKALTEGDYSRTVDLLLLLFPPLPHRLQEPRKEMIAVIQAHQAHGAIKEIPYTEKTASALVNKLTAVFFRYKIPAGMDFMRIDRTMLALDASLMHLCPHEDMVKMMRRYWKKARQRQFNRLAKQQKRGANAIDMLSLAVEGPQRVSEMLLLYAEHLRGRARHLQDRISKASYVLGAMASVCRLAAGIGLLYLTLGYLAQYHRRMASALLSPQALSFADRLPHLDPFLWIILFVLLLYLLLKLALLRSRAGQPEAHQDLR